MVGRVGVRRVAYRSWWHNIEEASLDGILPETWATKSDDARLTDSGFSAFGYDGLEVANGCFAGRTRSGEHEWPRPKMYNFGVQFIVQGGI